ncbi:hypothetical protein D9M69_637510 [compost metagenome]
MLAQSRVPSVVIRISQSQVCDIAFQIFNNVGERIGRTLANDIDVGLVRANVAEIGNADRGDEAFLSQPYHLTAGALFPIKTRDNQHAFSIS